ncbi:MULTISPECIES: LysR family transcriptional regulator [Variovorax]|jgi:DNA-binding transcriptional LysR family regulator|uniref:LysR family transcriptional regulator n=1 Tax=Variovorax TaxID=34072 RepID=UPI001786097C|nr:MULTISPECIES: LysR family transcriptional regulator [Variovorax]MBD9668809.1 LysR family transcriptional regulator [Variovorax sp. VRV01]MDR6452649.1 DNA-binding transcriptional LysR family regulator [Variovorax paradoxus]
MSLPETGDHDRRLDESLLRSLHALLSEASVSQAAAKLGVAQSALSRHLKVLRQLTGDELLVRVGNRMVLTERAQALAAPTRRILSDMSLLTAEAGPVAPHELRQSFRIATYDFLPRQFFADIAERVARQAPECDVVIRGLGSRFEHYRQLADGEVDMVITIWPELPGHLRAASLLTEPMVCLMREGHPLAKAPMTLEDYRKARHLSSLEHVPGQGTIIDAQLAELGVSVRTAMHTQFLGVAPAILARTDLVFTTGRLLAEDFARQYPLAIVPFPAKIKPHRYRLVWHERTHKNQAMRWLRGELTAAARELAHRPRS